MRPEAHGDRGPGSVLAGVGQAFLDGAVGRPLDRVRPPQPGRQVAVQAGGQAAVVNEPGDVREPGRRGQFVRLPGAEDANHDAELIQGSGGEVADCGGDVAGLRGGGGHPERPGLQRDQADLVGDDIVHLAGQAAALLGEHGAGEQHALAVLRLGELPELGSELAAGAEQQPERGRAECDEGGVDQALQDGDVAAAGDTVELVPDDSGGEGHGHDDRDREPAPGVVGDGEHGDQRCDQRCPPDDGGQAHQPADQAPAATQQQPGDGDGGHRPVPVRRRRA